MKAAFFERTGLARDVLQVGELPGPKAGNGEVLVRIHASGVNPSDVKTRSGKSGRPLMSAQTIPHNDGAGVIAEVGPGVGKERIGERVWLHNTVWARPLGTAAEFVAVPAEDAVHLPDGLSFAEGACLGVPLLTAYHGVMLNGSVTEKFVFVTGGAGAVGHYAVQIAKEKGARVIASVSSEQKAKVALDAGADHVLNYRQDDLAEEVSRITDGRGVDHYIEVNLSANCPHLAGLLAFGAMVAVYGSGDGAVCVPSSALGAKQIRMYFYNVYSLPQPVLSAAKSDLAGMLEAGRLQHVIAARFSLDEIASAHEAVERGSLIGNAVIEIP
jgi:NADPH2:quinone reductase